MKKIFAVVLTLVLMVSVLPLGLFSITASAETSDYYTYTVSNGEATITEVDISISGAVTIPSTLGGYPVTSIGGGAFSECKSLTSVTIPDSVTSIDYEAFYWCYNLTSVTIPNSVTSIGRCAFVYCDLTSVTIPDSVTSMAEGALSGLDSLTAITVDSNNEYYSSHDGVLFNKEKTELIQYPSGKTTINYTIPSSVTSIGESAFSDCECLTSVTIPDSVTSIGDFAFVRCYSLTSVTIPDSVTSIGESAFSECTRLISVNIPNSVTSIGESAFSNCYNLTSVTIPNSVTSIGNRAFRNTQYYDNDSSWENDVLYIGKHLIEAKSSISRAYSIKVGTLTIADDAFYGCESLISVNIPDSVTSIGDEAFYDCTSLISVTVPDSVTNIGFRAFYNTAYYNNDSNWENDVLYIGKHFIKAESSISGAYSIKEGTLTIAGRAFYSCYSLTSVTIPSSVTSIGDFAFYECECLTSVTIPDSVTSIGDFAFERCYSLTSVTIPDSVTSIGDEAFYDCTRLTDVHYGGSWLDRESISIGYNNSKLTDATWHYTIVKTDLDADNNEKPNNMLWIIITIGTVVLICCGVATVIFIKKKR